MPRALSRLALNRGGPRDLGACAPASRRPRGDRRNLCRDRPATGIGRRTGRHPGAAQALAQHLTQALGDELPLLKRDGGFVRGGYHAELDEMRALRDDIRAK